MMSLNIKFFGKYTHSSDEAEFPQVELGWGKGGGNRD